MRLIQVGAHLIFFYNQSIYFYKNAQAELTTYVTPEWGYDEMCRDEFFTFARHCHISRLNIPQHARGAR